MATLRLFSLTVTVKKGPKREELFDANRLVELKLHPKFTFELTDPVGPLEFCNSYGFWSSVGEAELAAEIRYCEPLDDEGRKFRVKARFVVKFFEHDYENDSSHLFAEEVETLIDYDTQTRKGELHDRRFISKFMRWLEPADGVEGGLYFDGRHIGRVSKPSAPLDVLRSFPIEELDFGVRVYNGLKRCGIDTIGDLADTAEGRLRLIPGFGQASIDEIKGALKRQGI